MTENPESSTPASFAQLRSLMARKARMINALRSFPGRIEEAQAKVAALRAQITADDIAFEASAAVEDRASVRAHRKQADACMDELMHAELAERRLRDRLAAMEPAIEELDDPVAETIRAVRSDADRLLGAMMQTLKPQVEHAAGELRQVMARVTAIREVFPSGATGHYMHGAYLPAADGTREYDATRNDFRPSNRLKADPAMVMAARNELAPQLAPIAKA